ncbi:hypothetical protein [Ideonella sp.]|jgi:hypothetical protein|uniref:hypothetical protein n=1 Tax=Ideonella sp. TaxID=1929293 RepID=UPI0037BE9F7A
MSTPTRFTVRALCILWPSFLMAGVLEMLVFSLVDPSSLQWFGGAPLEWSASAVYTVAFFVFWAVISTAGALTQMLVTTPADDEHAPVGRSAPRWPN